MFPIPDISRRHLLTGVATGALATPLVAAGPGSAQSMVGPELRAVHRFHLGEMRVTVIDDARFTFPAAAFAANQPEGTIGPFLGRFGLPEDFVSLHMQITLVETRAHRVLLDTGMGEVTFPKNPVDNGRLIAGLAAIGVTPDDITDVIISHGHPDHIGGCSQNGVPVFKNATYHIPPNEFEFWTQKPGDEQNFVNFMLAIGNSQLEPVRGITKPYGDGDEIVPGVTAISAPGHTIGHHAFILRSGPLRLLHMVDAAVHYLVGVEEPDWALAVEMDPDAAAATRRTLFKQAADEGLLVAGYHFPFPGIGRIVEQGPAWRFVPIQTA